jgi:ubiquinone/menaquinone biosynthesis C-methylase UbiE
MDEVTSYYGQLASVYGSGGYYGARRAAVVAAIAPELDRARTLLDLGCGNGAYSALFRERAGIERVVGIDLTEKMLQAARARLGNAVLLARADASALPFRDATFDLIFESHVLLFVRRKARALANVARCLRPGGVFVSTPHDERGGIRRAMRGAISAREWGRIVRDVFPHAQAPHPRDGAAHRRRLLEAAGLRVESRVAEFEVDWSAIEESFRARTLPLIDQPRRAVAETLFAEARARAGTRRFTLGEPLLLAHKPS